MSVELGQGESVSLRILRRQDGAGLPGVVRVELGWQPARRRGLFARRGPGVDLDATAMLFAPGRQLADVVFFKHLTSNDGSVRHNGDHALVRGPVRGEKDESIVVDLPRVPSGIDQIVFTVNSYTGQTFQGVARSSFRLLDEATGQELASYQLPGGGQHTGQVMAKVFRDGDEGGWQLEAIGAPTQAPTFQALLPAIAAYL